MTADDRADQIRARLAAATPGPWYWRNTGAVYLQGARTKIVMAFRRFGMQDAQPLFRVDGVLQDSARANIYDFPDADLIANTPADLAWLLAERDELLRRVEQAERAGAVKALRRAAGETNLAQSKEKVLHDVFNRSEVGRYLMQRADAIENGADL